MNFALNSSQMNLTQHIIYQGNIMNIWWGLWSVCSETANIALLSWCALMFTVLGECSHEKIESGFCWAFPPTHAGQRPRLLVGPKICAECTEKSIPQPAKQLYTLCWISWKIRVYDEVRSQTGFIFMLCHDNCCQLTREKMFPPDSKTCSTIDRWAWI